MKKNICILGGGISGLSLAYFLKEKYGDEIKITLIEKSPRLGGWVQTKKRDGFLIEQGPRGFRPTKDAKATLHLIEKLGLQRELTFSSPAAKTRFLLENGELQKVPTKLSKVFSSPLFKGCKRSFLKELFTKPSSLPDESIHQFFQRHFSKAFAERFVSALTFGIFAGDSEKLSAKACFPSLYRLDQSYGSIIKGFWKEKGQKPLPQEFQKYKKAGLINFKNGMHTLIEGLERQLVASYHTGCSVLELKKKGCGYEIFTSNGTFSADAVYSSLPLNAFLPLLHTKLKAPQIKSSSLSLVTLGFSKHPLKLPIGYGYLIPKKENEAIYGSTWDSQIFPEQNEKQLVTVFLDQKHREAKATAIDALSKHLNCSVEPDLTEVTSAKECIAQFPVGYIEKRDHFLKALKKEHPQLTLFGASLFGPAINQCTAKAWELANAD